MCVFYKSILRYIRKRYLKKHRFCLFKYFESIDKRDGKLKLGEICLFAYAYGCLRFEVEKHRGYFGLNRKSPIKLVIDDRFLKNIFERTELVFPIIETNLDTVSYSKNRQQWPVILWIISRLGEQILNTLKMWLKKAMANKVTKEMHHLKSEKENLLYFIETNNTNERLIIYWHPLKVVEEICEKSHIFLCA